MRISVVHVLLRCLRFLLRVATGGQGSEEPIVVVRKLLQKCAVDRTESYK